MFLFCFKFQSRPPTLLLWRTVDKIKLLMKGLKEEACSLIAKTPVPHWATNKMLTNTWISERLKVKVRVKLLCTEWIAQFINNLLKHVRMFYGSISITRFLWSIDACSCSGYQALLPRREGPGDEARLWVKEVAFKGQFINIRLKLKGCLDNR